MAYQVRGEALLPQANHLPVAAFHLRQVATWVDNVSILVITLLGLTLLAFSIIAFTGALPAKTIGTVLLSVAGASIIADVGHGFFKHAFLQADWQETIFLILKTIPFLVAGAIGMSGIASNSTVGWIALGPGISVVGLGVLYVLPKMLYARAQREYYSSPSRMILRLVNAQSLAPYFINHQNEREALLALNQSGREEVFQFFGDLFKGVLAEDPDFQGEGEANPIQRMTVETIVKKYIDRKDTFKERLDPFLDKHLDLKFYFSCLIDRYLSHSQILATNPLDLED